MSEAEAIEPTEPKNVAAVALARGLIAGWMNDQVKARGGMILYVGLGVAVVCLLILLFVSSTILKVLSAIGLAGALFALVAFWLVRKLAMTAISRFATPRSLAGQSEAISAAIEELDLPQSPLGIIRLLGRLRKGAGPEIARVSKIVNGLVGQIESS